MIRMKHKPQPGPHGQLVLTRRPGQSVVMRCPETGVKIVVTIAEIRNGKVRLATNAPKTFTVHRREVDETIHPDDYERGYHE